MQAGMAQVRIDAYGAQSEPLAQIDRERGGDGGCAITRAASADQQSNGSIDHGQRRELFRQSANRLGTRDLTRRVLEDRQRNQLPKTFGRTIAIGRTADVIDRQLGPRSLFDQAAIHRLVVLAHRVTRPRPRRRWSDVWLDVRRIVWIWWLRPKYSEMAQRPARCRRPRPNSPEPQSASSNSLRRRMT